VALEGLVLLLALVVLAHKPPAVAVRPARRGAASSIFTHVGDCAKAVLSKQTRHTAPIRHSRDKLADKRGGACRLGGRCIRLDSTQNLTPLALTAQGQKTRCMAEYKRRGGRRKREAPALTSRQVRRDEGGATRGGDTERGCTSIEMRNDERDEMALRPRDGEKSTRTATTSGEGGRPRLKPISVTQLHTA
jgi:hypothetical protein